MFFYYDIKIYVSCFNDKSDFIKMNKAFYTKKDTLPYYTFVMVFSLIAAFRGGTRDTSAYKFVYDNIDNFPLTITAFYTSTGMEVGFGWFAKIFNFLGLPFTVFLFSISFFTFYFIKRTADIFQINSVYVLLCYIPVFFANHQLMQIRQGLAIAIGFYFLSLILVNRSKLNAYLSLCLGVVFHNIAFIYLIFFSNKVNNFFANLNIKLYLKVLFVVVAVFIFCRLVTDLGYINLTDRVSNYSDSEYSEQRSFFHPANLRSLLLLGFFVLLEPKNKNNLYVFLVLLYSVGVGFRLGFYDFLILSGRVSTAFTFSEIFLIPILLKYRFSNVIAILFIFIYFILSLIVNIVYQVPFIIDDYFKPLW